LIFEGVLLWGIAGQLAAHVYPSVTGVITHCQVRVE
jgi:hypothetical protein